MEPTRQPDYEIRRYGAADWRQVREIRLEMLADSPLAYVESLAAARRYPAEEWRARAAWAEQPHCLGLAVVLVETGRWVGLARSSVLADLAERAFVFGVYLAPELRGHGIADDLFDRVERWVHAEGHRHLHLYVHESNARAIAFYRRRGYAFTGAASPTRSTPASPNSRCAASALTRTHPAPRREGRPPRSWPSRRSEVRPQVRQVGGASRSRAVLRWCQYG